MNREVRAKVDDLLEGYYHSRYDLIEVRKHILSLCDEVYNQALEDISSRLSEVQGRQGCTYGDTDFDSLSAVHGYNEAIENTKQDIEKLKI